MSIEKCYQNHRLSILQWETVGSQCANTINDMPLALGNQVGDFEVADILTPNRLLLGRNNQRSPEGTLTVSNDPSKFLDTNQKIFDAWFNVWLNVHVPKLMFTPKWFKTNQHLKQGDLVLFIKQESNLQSKYQFGIVKHTITDKDGLIRKVTITYQNASETTKLDTNRAARDLVMIHSVDDLDIMKELGEMAVATDLKVVGN